MRSDAALSAQGRSALECIGWGMAVFPLKARAKSPATAHGVNDWSDDEGSVREFWSGHPMANVGIACGTPSGGLLVLDFDVDEERDKDGLATLREWERVHGELPETAVSVTGGGGMHYLYRTDRTNIRPSTNAELGVDVRCDGSYIVAPGSVHPNGREYAWESSPDDVPIATATGAVYDFLDHVQRNGGSDETRKPNGKFALPERVAEGRRDDTLFRYASHLRAIGRSDAEILNAVAGANATRCQPPLAIADVERIVRSACRYERGEDEAPDGEHAVSAPGAGTVQLRRSPKGAVLQTTDNAIRAITADAELSGRFWYNAIAYQRMVTLPLPWDKREGQRPIKTEDYVGLTAYLERRYELTNSQKISDAAIFCCARDTRNPITEWLDSLEWDGRRRVGTMLPTVFGADDDAYVREVERLLMLGAVSRAYEPGCKFDYVPILVGPQGIGKSQYVRLLAHVGEWYSDNFNTIDGDGAVEKIRGLWIAELAELLATKRAREVEAIKAFVTSTKDVIRPKYERETVQRRRVCVFVGTTNDQSFLTDSTGNRRFLPVECRATGANPWLFCEEAPAYVEQMWAEAVREYKEGHPTLVLSRESQEVASALQEAHTEDDPIRGVVEEWASRRRAALLATTVAGSVAERVCTREVFEEMPEDVRRGDHRYVYKALAAAMDACGGWVRKKSKQLTTRYGIQRVWVPERDKSLPL